MNSANSNSSIRMGVDMRRESSSQTGLGQRRLRVAVLNRIFSPTGGGAERYSIALVEQLAMRHDIHVFAQSITHHIPGVTFHTISTSPIILRWLNQVWYANATWRATRHGFDVTHSHENVWRGEVQTVHVLPTGYKLFHGVTPWKRILRYLKVATSPRLITYLLLERARCSPGRTRRVVATSEVLRDQIASAYPSASATMRVVTPGVNMPTEVATPKRRLEARKQLGLPQTGRGILFVGNDYAKKGLNTLLKALAKFNHNTWLAVVGNNANIAEFQRHAQQEGVLDRVHFLGSLQNINTAYAAVDCLAHPTLEDTFAMVVVEAMAHAIPVVVSDRNYCGISGLLAHESNALLLKDPRDPDALHAALARVLDNDSLRQALCAAAVQFASGYQWSTIARLQEKIYFEVAP